MILVFLTVSHRRQTTARPLVAVGIFLFGYLAVWSMYSAVATLAQWGLHKAALLSPTMAATSPVVSGGLLLAAGVFLVRGELLGHVNGVALVTAGVTLMARLW